MDSENYDEWVEEPSEYKPPSDFESGRNRRGGGGRGRGRGSSYGGRNDSNGWQESNNENDSWEKGSNRQSSDFQEGGRGRGRGRGPRGRFNNSDSEGGFDGGSYGNQSRGGWRSGGGDGDFNDWESNDRGNDFGGGGGSSGGRGRGRGRRNFDDEDKSYRNDRGARDKDGEHGDQPDEKPKERYIPPEPTDDENIMFGSTISSGINFDKFDSIQVKVSGDNVPKPVSSFEECQLRNLLLENVKKSGYTKPTPVQKHALPIICSGRDLMACAQTGSGKTAAFLLPIINSLLTSSVDATPGRPVAPQVIICSPTRELSIQIFQEARKFAHGSSLKICIAYGGTVTYHQASTISRGCNILVATPGRLNDFVNKDNVTFSGVQFFVLDEADRMLDMGFLPAVEQMLQHESMTPLGERQTLMFSATFPDDIQRLASKYLQDYLFLAVGIVGGACADVEQVFYEVQRFDKRQKLMEVLSDNKSSEKELTLVFVEKKRTADFIAAFLSENNFPTTSIHGDRLQSQREEALRDFKSGRMPILVATAVAARGLDIKNVAHVINYDLPSSIEEYVHRIGRTGRVGNRGRATSFFEPNDDQALVSPLVRILDQTGQEIPAFLQASGSASFKDGPRGNPSSSQDFGGWDLRGQSAGRNMGAQPVEVDEEWN